MLNSGEPPSSQNHFVTRYLPPSELHRYIAIGRKFFPVAPWDDAYSRLQLMLAKWPSGIIVAEDGSGEISGYMTLWPLKDVAALQIESGAITDDDIDASLIPESQGAAATRWIITAIAVTPTVREQRRDVIRALLDKYQKTTRNVVHPTIYAHAATIDGERFLKRSGFTLSNDAEQPLYMLKPMQTIS